MSTAHEMFMQRCLDLALRGAGKVSPNPMVGSVIVHDGVIISEGWHHEFGKDHAERDAILKIQGDPRLSSSTLHVNLEPCAHYGKTPPCANLIIENKIPNVVIGSCDPFPEVNGKGIELLKTAGVNVVDGVLKKECDTLNRRFLSFHTKKRPYIILKWAETADGFMAPENKERIQISGPQAAMLLHKWRAEEAAILVGANTLMIDKPSLNVRFWEGKDPLRIVIDGNLKNRYLDLTTLVFNFSKNTSEGPINFVKIPENNTLSHILQHLYNNHILSILVEGGAHTLKEFLKHDLWDEIRVIQSKKNRFQRGHKSPEKTGFLFHSFETEDDVVQYYRKENNGLVTGKYS